MNCDVSQNGKAIVSKARQQFLLEMEYETPESANGEANPKAKRTRGQKRQHSGTADGSDMLAIAHILRDELGRFEARLAVIESLAREIHAKSVSGSLVKDHYTTQEVARILGKRPYTVREWCRLGRVYGEKSHSGRGLDEEWRISHDELMRIQNEGLLMLKKSASVERPKHLK